MKLISCSELKQMLDEQQDFILLSVLSRSSFRKSHIPRSKNIPVTEPDFISQVRNLLGGKASDYPIVTYCAGLHCNASKDATNLLMNSGYTNVCAFEGGMSEWLDAGYSESSDEVSFSEKDFQTE